MPRVLVVEDDIDLNWTVCRVLNSHGYQTSAWAAAEEALLRFRRQRPDLILLDVHLPRGRLSLARDRASVDGDAFHHLHDRQPGTGEQDHRVRRQRRRLSGQAVRHAELLMRIQAVLPHQRRPDAAT